MKLDMAYRRTASGDVAVRSVDTAIPVDYRRILCLIDEDTHANVVRGRLRQYSDALIVDWLAELEEIGFIESTRAGDAHDLDFELPANYSPSIGAPGELPDEQRRIENEARTATTALVGKGAYLATARLQNREPLSKDPEQTGRGTEGGVMRVVLTLLLLIAAAPALAQWVKVDGEDNAIHYIDRTTITKSGAMRRVWVTQYLREKGPNGEMSRRAFLEFDCAGRRFRYLSIASHSALAAGGQTPSSQGNAPKEAGYIPAAIDDERVQRIICAP